MHHLELLPKIHMEQDNISLSLQIANGNYQQSPVTLQTSMMLHSVRKSPAKPWRRPEPTPPKVYRVDPQGFRKLVQKLTGAPKRAGRSNSSTRVPPPPLDLGLRPTPRTSDKESSMEMISPSMMNSPYGRWCSFPLLSPGTMASWELSNGPVP